MNKRTLEQILKEMEAPAVPDDLLSRCYQTIPINAESLPSRQPTMKGKRIMYKVAIGLLILGLLSLRIIHPHLRSGVTFTVDIAFTQAVAATQQVPFFHEKTKSMGFNLNGGEDGKTWYSGRWMTRETWFDAEQGSYSISGGPTFAASQMLWLPNGAVYDRVEDHLKVTQFTPKDWRNTARGTISHLLDLRTSARGFNYTADPKPEPRRTGNWKGKPAVIFAFVAPPSSDNAAKGAPTVKTLFYVDGVTKLCMAEEQYAQSQSGEYLVNQSEFDYAQKPDSALFDPKRIETGVSRISHAEGRPGEPLDPDMPPDPNTR